MSWLPASPLIRWAVLGAVALLVLGGLVGAGWAWYSSQEAQARQANDQARREFLIRYGVS